jgi:hypothetical protein
MKPAAASLAFVILLLSIFGAYLGLATYPFHSSNASTGGCASPIPRYSGASSISPIFGFFPVPNPVETHLANDSILVRGWVPVFLMPQNSTGTICVIFSHLSDQNSSFDLGSLNSDFDAYGSTPPSVMASLVATPSQFSLSGVQNQSVALTISAPPGSKGIYSMYIPEICGRENPVVAVGYLLSELNSSLVLPPTGPTSCPTYIVSYDIFVGVTNVQVAYVPFEYISSPSAASESVVFSASANTSVVTLRVPFQSYSKPVTMSFDAADSQLVKFSQNPELEYSQSTGLCSWSVSNIVAIRAGMLNASLGQSSEVSVRSTVASIQANSYGILIVSIQVKNLTGGFYAMNLFARVETGSNSSNLYQVALNFPLNPSGMVPETNSLTMSC